MHEPIAREHVRSDAAVPAEGAGLLFDGARIEPARFARGDDAEIAGVPKGVLAMRSDVVPLLAHHLVELRAAVAAHELDAGSRMLLRERAEQIEQPRIEVMAFAGDTVG